jgi:hypothetical protein
MASQAHLALGNVMSSMLKMPKAVQSYRLAGRYLQRLRAPDGSEAKVILAGMQASLQCNIGNQYKKENLFGKAMEAYQTAATLADQASDTDLGLQVRGKRRLFLCGVFSWGDRDLPSQAQDTHQKIQTGRCMCRLKRRSTGVETGSC